MYVCMSVSEFAALRCFADWVGVRILFDSIQVKFAFACVLQNILCMYVCMYGWYMGKCAKEKQEEQNNKKKKTKEHCSTETEKNWLKMLFCVGLCDS